MNLLIPDVKTDAQIYALALADWTAVLTQLWDAIGKTPDRKQLAVYIKQLGDIPLGILEKVVQSVLADHKYNTVPTIGEMWRNTWLIMGNSQKDDTDMKHLKLQLVNWCPAPRGDKYAEVE